MVKEDKDGVDLERTRKKHHKNQKEMIYYKAFIVQFSTRNSVCSWLIIDVEGTYRLLSCDSLMTIYCYVYNY